MTTAPDLTLYGIETQLMELLNFRDSILEDPDMTPADQKDSLEAIDRQVAEYIRAEVKKCDGIANYLREFEVRKSALMIESERLKAQAKAWEKRQANLKAMVIGIMQATKQTLIEGRHSVLQLKKNPPSVEISQPELVPEELRRVTVTLPEAMWLMLSENIAPEAYPEVHEEDPEPIKDEIKKRLKEGTGVPGCRLRTDSVRLEVK